MPRPTFAVGIRRRALRRVAAAALVALAAGGGARVARAEEAPKEPPHGPWYNSTELSLVLTKGNSDVQTLGFKDTLEYKASRGRSRFRIDSLHSNTSDDPYLLVQSGLTFLPGETPTTFSTTEVRPGTTPDVARDFVEGTYEGNRSKGATWNAGASWDRNEDAGIVSRSIVFAGLGRKWRDRDDLKFRTSYGLSYTDRLEDVEDPEKERRFAGARLTSYFMVKWGQATTYDIDFTFNDSLSDFSDYNVDLTQGLGVSMSKRLALKISLQLTYAGEPALEEVDVLLRALVVDPDGIPGNGDEFFETVSSGGSEITVGEDVIRKESLDSTFRTSLVINF